ncbi:MAG: 2,3-bisphosphoglycerate-independent phosphoglycerate mutase [bacterium]|nr:2,3-bisphosphoglycerate-independent phosphoglycerate mutase [bacterium]
MSKRTVVLIVLDGWGMGRPDESNPIHVVNPQNINYLKANFPSGTLQASGISVGLPWGEEGNSEVGHLNLGAGKIIYQNYPRISLAIHDKSFFENPALKTAFEHSKKNNSAVNLVGLLSEGNVHSSFEHLLALIDFAKKEGVKINLHLFTDGRDSRPDSALELLAKLPKEDFVRLSSLSGRFYAMDREKHWDRTQKTYSVLTGDGPTTDNIETHIKKTYERKFNDEFVEPVSLISPISPIGPIKDNDSIIFFNFREDRMKQIASAFIDKNFRNFPVKNFNNLYVAAMVQYDDDFNVPIAFPPKKIETCLGKILAEREKNQLRIAETQKYPHITYFFNGMREEPFKNEYRILIPSKTIIRQDEHPEMMANEITTRIIESIGESAFDFILANYANPDMIAHTGNYEACIKAVEIIDEQIGKITKAILESNAVLIITSDHGNMERVFNPLTGEPETQHDPNPVPIYLVAKEYMRPRTGIEIRQSERESVGVLADITPTVLELLGIPKPKEMTGRSLLSFLN